MPGAGPSLKEARAGARPGPRLAPSRSHLTSPSIPPRPTTHPSPADKYAPWFGVPLKSARLAVKVIQMLAEAERASRLSFPDVIKRLAEEPEGSPLFISRKPERVERFVVVHGQIFLNQIKAFPKQVRGGRGAGRARGWLTGRGRRVEKWPGAPGRAWLPAAG